MVGALSRRKFLAGAGVALAAPAALRFPVAWAQSDPFALGVASGDPWPDGMVLWTRLMLGADPGEPPARSADVRWELAEDEGFKKIVREGDETATPGLAHSLHIEPRGLRSGRRYWYRFHHAGATSPIGRTRTAPAPGETPDRFRFAFASCQQYEQGYYAAHRHLAREDLDLVLFLGDYIYEISYGRTRVREHGGPPPATLAEYRRRHALYKSDRDLQASHAAHPWASIWDDHEVENDYAQDRPEKLDQTPEAFLKRRAAAYQAFWEHLPLREAQRPRGPDARLYRRLDFGAMASVLLLDDRQHRSYHACPRPGRAGSNVVGEECAERADAERTMLGRAQEDWFARELAARQARWSVIAQQTLVARFDQNEGQGRRFWTEAWDGYPAARDRLIGALAETKAPNPLIVGGDLHAFFACDIKRDFDRPESPGGAETVASEFVGGSITSQALPQARLDRWKANNPHMHLAEGRRHGYGRCTLTRQRAEIAFRAVEDILDPRSAIETFAAYAVESGKPGVKKA
ncbi:MAG: alkaline phosphatase D family protein [Rhodospirillales bacterium]